MVSHAEPGWVINTGPDEFWPNIYQLKTLDAELLTLSVMS